MSDPKSSALAKAGAKNQEIERLAKSFGLDLAGWSVVTTETEAYWKPKKGTGFHGVIESRRVIDTPFGETGMYTVRLLSKCLVTSTTKESPEDKEGPQYEAKPGDMIAVLDRKAISDLEHHIGKEVLCACTGTKLTGKGFTRFKFLVMASPEKAAITTTGHDVTDRPGARAQA